jgi:hypothetical protein
MKDQVTDDPTMITEPITMAVTVVSVPEQAIMISGPILQIQKWSSLPMVKARILPALLTRN